MGFIDDLTLLQGPENKEIAVLYHALEFIGRVHQDISVDARQAEPGHHFQALDAWLRRLFDHQHVQIALRIGLVAGGQTKKDDTLRLLVLQGLQHYVERFFHETYLRCRRIQRQGSVKASGSRKRCQPDQGDIQGEG